jgi:uncharacterized protein (TIGR00251 family)
MGNMTDKKTTLEIHLQPGAKRNEVAGFRDGVLYVKVTALPQKGQANRALLELMAQTLGVPKSALAIIRGYTGRNKVVVIQGLTAVELKDILALNLPCKDFLNLLK